MNRAANNPCNRQKAAIALGSNVGSPDADRASHLAFARDRIASLPGTTLLAASSDHVTAPVGLTPGQDTGGPYLNACVTIETSLSPRALLDRLLEIERDRGRDRLREQRWGPRTLDLDLILYADLVIDEPGLQIPHPRLAERPFVLDPLAEIAGAWVVPGHDASVSELAQATGHARP